MKFCTGLEDGRLGVSQSNGSQFERPMCDSAGCENISSFHGFGVDKCWSCYPRFMASEFGVRIGGTASHDVIQGTRQTASTNCLGSSSNQMLLF